MIDSLPAAVVTRSHSPLSLVVTAAILVVFGLSLVVAPQWMVSANDWLVRNFAWAARVQKSRRGSRRPSLRRARIAGLVTAVVAAGMLAAGIERL